MNTLPFDWCRCVPMVPDHNCQNCKRWLDHQQQVNGPRTAVVHTTDSRDNACMYIPISLQRNDK